MGSFSSFLTGVALEMPGQHANFISEPLPVQCGSSSGSPTVQIRAASPTGEAVLFVKLYDTDPQAGSSLPFGLAAPVRLTGLPADIEQAQPVTVTLPAIVHRFEAGHRLRLTIATSDQAYATPVAPTVYTVGVLAGRVDGDTAAGDRVRPITNPEVIWRYVLGALLAVVALGTGAAFAGRANPPAAQRGVRRGGTTPTRRWSSGACARSTPTASWRCPTSTSQSSVDRSSACSARTAPERRPRCACCSA